MEFKKGDEIICVDNENDLKPLTIGHSYIVLETSKFLGRYYVNIKTDRGKNEDYLSGRFVLKTQQHINKEQIFQMFNNIFITA